MPEQWSFGETVVRRELLHGHPWIGFSTYVVEDTDQLLAVYLAEGSRLGFPDWPFEEWVHCPGRDFAGWYVNLQEPIVRHERGFDTLDHELDFWLHPDGTWSAKDQDLFEQRVVEGRYSAGQASAIRATGQQVAEMLSSGSLWWDDAWARWRPPSGWRGLDLPDGWSESEQP